MQRGTVNASGGDWGLDPHAEAVYHLHGDHTGVHQTNSWLSSSTIVIGAMAGAGVLGIAQAVQASGWFGIILLFIVAVFNVYTGLILGSTMREMPFKDIKDYASIGEFAFGRFGRWASHFSQYVTLAGVSIIFLVLVGLLMNEIVDQVPRGFFTLVIGICMIPLLIIFRSMSEASWASYMAVLATLFVAIVAVAVSLQYYASDDYSESKSKFTHDIVKWGTMAEGFSVFTFAFGATALFPNVYRTMKQPDDWPKAILVAYPFALLTMYFPVAIVGYLVYGNGLSGTSDILAALLTFQHTSQAKVWVKVGAGVIVFHLLCALPLVITPVLQKAEEIVNKNKRFLLTVLVRAVIIIAFTGIGLVLPYFLQLVQIVTVVSVTISCYLLPPLFYLKVVRPAPYLMIFLCVLTFVFGLVGSGVGLYEGVKQLIDAIHANPNPFKGLFTFK
eukprot:TRINITY_DN4109_c0_g1_i3.p1 TRINITY_DN4109_c0_g1~~TRINITY_DN4109_c0_g1_i3.p1  ORF type:complete len:469 (-),score=48.09 TRINITY_DN4109_c0_g1_i3:28-1362(-)